MLKRRGERGWTPIYKLALIKLFEAEKIHSKEIMRELLLKLKDALKVLAQKQLQDLQTTKWVKSG